MNPIGLTKVAHCEKKEEIIKNFVNVTLDDGTEIEIDLSNVRRKQAISRKRYKADLLLKTFEVDNIRYHLFTDSKGTLSVARNLNHLFLITQKLYYFRPAGNIVFFGILSNISKRFPDCDKVYINDDIVSRVYRPFKSGKLKHLALIKVSPKDLENSSVMHNDLSVGDSEGNYVPIRGQKRSRGMKYFSYKKMNKDFMLICRTTLNGFGIKLTKVPFEEEYRKRNRVKNFFAYAASKFVLKREKLLLFEKEASTAAESGWYVFTKLVERKNLKEKTFYILDEKSPAYSEAKGKFGRNIIKKYSFRHYLYIYTSQYFISSELSNHVINPRVYIKSLNKTISKKPLIFLQHGIMFAKPVENPAAEGFYKGRGSVNVFKSVISSDLEAEQFYKMGYTDYDLIKCGLPKFDISKGDNAGSKILFMPTYRYWEEAQISDADMIKETSYYRLMMSIIEEFEQQGLIKDLRLAGHPKFSASLIQAMPEYEYLIENNIGKALQEARIFITDYSSASYDAHYRGAYIIYYWAERDYLIENYQAVPPINEENCDGVPVFSMAELAQQVKVAISKDYQMDELYKERYKKINEFSDNRNCDRLIDYLEEEGIV